MFKRTLLLLSLVIPFIFSCKMADTDLAEESRSINDVLTSFPNTEFNLPKSLQESGNDGTAAGVGDISSFSALSTEPGVKADGWYRVKRATSGESGTAEMLMAYIRHIASLVELEAGRDIDLGVLTVPPGQGSPSGGDTMDMGTIHIKMVSDSLIDVFWAVAIPEMEGAYYIKMSIELLADDNMVVETYMSFKITATGEFINESYSSYNSQTGNAFEFYDETMWGGAGAYSVQSLTRNANGDVELVDSWTGDWGTGTSVAWANDEMGGIAYANEWYDDYIGQNRDSISVEFYDENGFLVKEGWGDSSLITDYMGLDWFDEATNSYSKNLNGVSGEITSAPNSFTITEDHSGTYTRKITGVNGSALTNAVDITGNDYWDFYWKEGADWASGDRTFWCTNWSWDDGSSTSTATYTKGFTVPIAATYLGKDYYMNNNFPLRYLSVNKPGFTLMNREGNTNTYSWSDDITGETWSWSWTDYTWWLDNNDPAVGTVGQYGTDDDGDGWLDNNFDTSDIPLDGSLYLRDYYIWDYNADQSIQQQAYTYQTNEDEPSDLFVFTEVNLVNTVKANLEALYTASKTKYSAATGDTLDFPVETDFPAP